MTTARVSSIEDYRWWSGSGLEWDWFINKDRSENDRMRAGTALHDALERAAEGEHGEMRSGEYIFVFECDYMLAIPQRREFRRSKQYGDLTVTGKTDFFYGKAISDFKLIVDHQVEGEQYMDSYQWRYYLDIFDADVFDYLLFQAHEDRGIFYIQDIHKITQFRYPDLRSDCADLAADFLEAAERSPELRKIIDNGLEDDRADGERRAQNYSGGTESHTG